MSPQAGPLASSTAPHNPHSGAVIWLVAPMTVSALPFFSFFSLLTPAVPFTDSLHAAFASRGGWL